MGNGRGIAPKLKPATRQLSCDNALAANTPPAALTVRERGLLRPHAHYGGNPIETAPRGGRPDAAASCRDPLLTDRNGEILGDKLTVPSPLAAPVTRDDLGPSNELLENGTSVTFLSQLVTPSGKRWCVRGGVTGSQPRLVKTPNRVWQIGVLNGVRSLVRVTHLANSPVWHAAQRQSAAKQSASRELHSPNHLVRYHGHLGSSVGRGATLQQFLAG